MATVDLFSAEITKLLRALDEAVRSDLTGSGFVEPTEGILDTTLAKRHHIIFGRRGSGKSSLLGKLKARLAEDHYPVIYVDVESINQNTYPDLLITAVLRVFRHLKEWHDSNTPMGAQVPIFRRMTESGRLSRTLSIVVLQLEALLHSADEAELEVRNRRLRSRRTGRSLGLEISGVGAARVGRNKTDENETEVTENYRRSKIELLNRNVERFREILEDFVICHDKDIYVLVDDLYHVRAADQAPFVGFLHKVAKGNRLWLKIGTIRYRSVWYRYGEMPIGMKIGDDASEVDLDLTLENYATTKRFLTQVISEISSEVVAPGLTTLVTGTGIDRMIIASGGVARDFINVYRSSILKARARLDASPKHHRGPRVTVEDVNEAAGDVGDSKLEEFKGDSNEDQEFLRTCFERLREFCLGSANANIFLVPQDVTDQGIEELVDLRLLHRVAPRVTISKRQGRVYKAFMLDISQYVGSRAIHDFEMIEFWRGHGTDTIRRVGLILPEHALQTN